MKSNTNKCATFVLLSISRLLKLPTDLPVKLVFSLLSLSFSGDLLTQNIRLDYSSAWFSPQLTESKSEVCGAVADAIINEYSIADTSFNPDGLTLVRPVDLPHLGESEVPERGRSWDGSVYILGNDKRHYIFKSQTIGCGGGCNSYTLHMSTTPFPLDRPSIYEFLRNSEPTTFSGSSQLYRNQSNEYFVLSDFYDRKEVAALNQIDEWERVCTLKQRPSEYKDPENPSVETTKQVLDNLRQAVGRLTRGAGSCGTMRTHGRWADRVKNLLDQLMYRPYLNTFAITYGDSTYDLDLVNLSQWGNTGLLERNALDNYERKFAEATKTLTAFYEDQFGLSRDMASSLAHRGLTHAVSSGIRFYFYKPFESSEEMDLREAILKKRPLEEIQQYSVPLEVMNAERGSWLHNKDSMLNIAIEYPEALEYMLVLGVNPNQPNEFGKTPLMYAAQYNAIEAARLLLEFGADPNATTIWPVDTCYYTLRTASMTPLHYAARYASEEFINLLLEAGANTYMVTDVAYESRGGDYAIDWLERYASPNADEKNPHISNTGYERLKTKLNVPDDSVRASIARQQTIQAKVTYQAGDYFGAYELLKKAVLADPTYEGALLEMSSVGILAGFEGEAARAALTLIETNEEEQLSAHAWFNLGLACAKKGNYLIHNKLKICNYSYIHYFLQSWKIDPSELRENKIVEVFREFQEEQTVQTQCDEQNGSFRNYHVGYRVHDLTTPETPIISSIIYLLHDPEWRPNPELIELRYGDDEFWRNPTFIERVEFAERTISVFSVNDSFRQMRFRDFGCMPDVI